MWRRPSLVTSRHRIQPSIHLNPMPAIELLNNPIWNSLSSAHNNLALGNGLAKCYPAEIGPLSGLAERRRLHTKLCVRWPDRAECRSCFSMSRQCRGLDGR